MNPASPSHRPPAGLGYLAAAILGFGSVPLFIKHFTAYLDAWTVNAVRYSTAALIWLPFVLLLLRRNPRHGTVWRAALFPAAVNLLGQVFWALTPYYNDAAIVGFGIRVAFLFTLAIGLVWLPGERRLARLRVFWIGTAVCIAGVAVMYSVSLAGAGGTSPTGIAVIMVTAVFWALYAVSVRRYLCGYPVRLGFGVTCLYTAAGLVVLGLWQGDLRALGDLDAGNWALLLASAAIGIAASHVMLYKSIAALGPVVTSGGQLLCPLVTWLGAAVLLGESLNAAQAAGGMVLVGGTLLLVRARERSTA